MSKRLYGPVPSRRFGLSLGVDLVPRKVCTFDCAYCQLGPTTKKRGQRVSFFPAEEVVAEVAEALRSGPGPNVITFAGSGEPTLYLHLGEVARQLRQVTDLPLLLITNGSLLHRPDVAADAARFDIVAPSLDAGDEATFQRINSPLPGLSVNDVIDGIAQFSTRFSGTLALEVFFVRRVNDSPASLDAIADAVKRIAPDRVDLNTVARPTPGRAAEGVDREFLEEVGRRLPCLASPIAGPAPTVAEDSRWDPSGLAERIHATVARRPCTAADLAASLAASEADVAKALARLVARRQIAEDVRGRDTYFICC